MESKARGRLQRLNHKTSIKKYVKKFQELLSEIPDMSDKNALFAFLDDLQNWASEVMRHDVQDLLSANCNGRELDRVPTSR